MKQQDNAEQLDRIERTLAELKAAIIELVQAITANTAEMNDLEDAAATPKGDLP